MKLTRLSFGVLFLFVAATLWSGTGCTKKEGKDPIAKARARSEDAKKEPEGKHDGWWCPEHGVPEHLCSLCNDEVAAKLKPAPDGKGAPKSSSPGQKSQSSRETARR